MNIRELAEVIYVAFGFFCRIVTNPAKTDGRQRKLSNAEWLCALGWQPRLWFREGLVEANRWFVGEGRPRRPLAPLNPA